MMATSNLTKHWGNISSCASQDFSLTDKTFLGFFLLFLGGAFFSSMANGVLFYLMVRYRRLLWQPQYILIKNISACGIGMSFVTSFVMLSSVLQQKTQIYGSWCVAQFCILRFFFLTTQMTLALMAIERYIFICHGIYFLRIVNTCNVYISIGVIWLVSMAVSFQGGLILSQNQCGFKGPTSGLVCDAFTIKRHISFSWEEAMMLLGPPSLIMSFCILAICCCYGCMYNTALQVRKVLKLSNTRANRTVGYYFLMFVLQLLLNILFIVLTSMEKNSSFTCSTISSLVTPLLIVFPSGIIAAFFLIRNPQIKQQLFCACNQRCHSATVRDLEVIQQSNGSNVTGGNSCQVEPERQIETPLPGSVSPFVDV